MLYESRQRLRNFDETPFDPSEDGFLIEFSNQGQKRHINPNPMKLTNSTIPCIVPGCHSMARRLDGLCKDHAPKKGENRPRVISKHWADWIGRVIPPGMSREQCLRWAPPHTKLLELLISWKDEKPKERRKTLKRFVLYVMNELKGAVPDSTKLQDDLEHGGQMAQKLVVDRTREIVDEAFPLRSYEVSLIPNPGKYKGAELDGITVRTVAGLLVLGIASEEANRGDLWTYNLIGKPASSKRASVFMPMIYYFLRVDLGATRAQASQSIRH